MIKAIKYRIYPNKEQEQLLHKTFGSCRYIYNYFLAERIRSYRKEGLSLSYNQTSKLLTLLKSNNDYSFLKEVDSMALQESLRNLDQAYKNFFQKKSRFPKFHSKRNKQSYRTRNQGDGIRIEGKKIRLPKMGYITYKGKQPVNGKILNATVSLSVSGKYFISLCLETEENALSNNGGLIGLDVGLKAFYTDSNGNTISNPKVYRKHEKKLKREQRKLSRKKKGSNNRKKQRIRLAIQYEKISNVRNDFLHKTSSTLANENQVVCVEDLHIKGMLRNHHLAKSISDASWFEFFRQLEYKTAWRGGTLIKVPTFYPSSQTCSCCGYQNPLVKNLSVRKWTCPECGATHDRDQNAAINILKKGLEMLAS